VERIPVSTTTRYVRMLGIQRATPYGYSIYELGIE
jgi:hypothetical protein